MSVDIQSFFPPRRTFDFLSLPPEIRNTIYELLLIKNEPIHICSPLRKHAVNQELTSTSFSMLLRLNKQINAEASTIFYSKNKFVLGNGAWGSTSLPNVHGLKAFLGRVPNKYLAHITEVTVEVHCRQYYRSEVRNGFYWAPAHHDTVHELGTLNDAANLHFVSRALATRFKRLEHLTYMKLDIGPRLFTHIPSPETVGLSKDQATKQLEKSLLLVLKNANLKDVQTFSDDFVDMEAAVEKILTKRPEAAKIFKVVQPQNYMLATT